MTLDPRALRSTWRLRSRAGLLALSALLLAACAGGPRPAQAPVDLVRMVASATVATGTRLDGLEVGGLSALSYDRAADVLYAVVDDPPGHPPARLLRFRWHPPAPPLLLDWLTLKQADGSPLPVEGADLEGLAMRRDGSFFVSSEGDVHHGIGTWVGRFDRQGRLQEKLTVPAAFTPGAGHGNHHNLALEALVLAPDEGALYAGSEGPLVQDEPGPDGAPLRSRILRWEPPGVGAPREWLYPLDPPHARSPRKGGVRVAGLVDVLPWGDRFLTLERSWVEGVGFDLKLYEATLAGAEEVSGRDALARVDVRPARKRLLADLARLHAPIDNYEGMVWGPPGADGRPQLLLVCDNNFNPLEQTYLLALELGDPPPID